MKRALPWMLLALLGTIWGTNFLFMRLAVQVIPPLEVAWLRTLFGAVPVLIFAVATGALHPRDARHLHHFAAMAMLANVGPYVFFVIGSQNLPSSVAGVISGAIPVITAVIVSVALPDEQLTRTKLIGFAIGFLGIVLVAPIGLSGHQGSGLSSLLGVGAMLAGSISYALALVYAKRFVAPLKLGAVKLAAYQMLLAFGFLAPFAAPGHWSTLAAHPTATLGLVVGLGLLGTGVAFVIYYDLIAKLGALKASSVYYIPPVVALVVGAVFAGDALGAREIGGAILIALGVYWANRGSSVVTPPKVARPAPGGLGRNTDV